MRRFSSISTFVFTMSLALNGWASMDDDPILISIAAEELEWRQDSGNDALAWDAHAWVGKDRDKLWFKSEGEKASGTTEDFELQLLYNRAVAAFWDLQIGWRHDWQPISERDWLAIGVSGEAPGFIETEATLFVGENGRTSLRAKFGYEYLLTRNYGLKAKFEFDWFSKDDPSNGIGSGLAELEFGIRLHYAPGKQMSPYLGLNWSRLLGETGDFAAAEGESDSSLAALLGISWWF